MAKKKQSMTPEEQSQRFVEEAQKLIDAGELSPIDAADALDRLTKKSLKGGS